MQWFYILDGQRFGPVEESDLVRLAREGKLAPDDLVWNPSMDQEWKPAASIPGLFEIPAAQAPGVPGATPNRDLMARARSSLSGRWGLAVAGTLLFQLLTGGASLIPVFGALLIFLLYGPMLVGWSLFFLKIARRDSPKVAHLFGGFKRFGAALGAYLLVTLFILLWCLPILLPCLFAAFAIPAVEHTPAMGALLLPLILLLGALSVLPVLRAALSYAQTFYLLADHSELGPLEAIRRSREMMDGFKWKLFCLGFRFVGWLLLAAFTLGIGLLWIQPYMAVANAHFYDDIQGKT